MYILTGTKNPTIFTLKVNHGGFFTMGAGRRYLNGKVSWFDWVDGDEWSIIEFTDMLGLLGYKNEVKFYHYKIPNTSLDEGLRPLVSDSDIIEMVKHIGSLKVIEVFTELWLSVIDHPMSQPESKINVCEVEVPVTMSNPLPSKKKPKQKPKKKFVKKLTKKELAQKMLEFEEWPGSDHIDMDDGQDNVVPEKHHGQDNVEPEKQHGQDNVVPEKQNVSAQLWLTDIDMENFDPFYPNNVNTEVGQSSGLNRSDVEPIVETETGEPSKGNKKDIPNTEVDDQALEDEDHLIDDVEVDMESFKRNFANESEKEAD